MRRSLAKILLWFPISSLFLAALVFAYPKITRTKQLSGLIRQEVSSLKASKLSFAALPRTAFEIKTAIASEDARPILIERYLKHYQSPMAGNADYIIKISDRFNVDPYLVVAIAQQESNLGKLMPPNCHNAWGWGIHSAGTLCFDTWEEGINTFVSGLSEKYLAYGLKTPEEIMTKYNATSPNGAWAKGVSQFLEELHSGEW